MSAALPDPEGDEMRALLDGLDLALPVDVVDYTTKNRLELSVLLQEVTDKLYEREEMLQPSTDEGRRLHSERAALLIALKTRHGA